MTVLTYLVTASVIALLFLYYCQYQYHILNLA